MKIPVSWLREYVKMDLGVEEISRRLTMAGLEVGKIHVIGENWDRRLIRAAKIVTIEPHPNADRLQLPTLDIGENNYVTVVCGAPNIHVGQIVAFAQEGSKLLDYKTGVIQELKGAKIRGIQSRGMVCSALELGLSDDHEGILELPEHIVPGTPLVEVLGDTILETELTPNRPDCLSVLGTSYEIAALTSQTVVVPNIAYETNSSRDLNNISVKIIDPKACTRYTGALIRNVLIGDSPDWLKNRLELSGVRSINNVVDITNYVMLEYGQPLHAFDADKLEGDEINIRFANQGETLVTLDGVTRNLENEMLVIADKHQPIGLAGIMGGANTEVDDKTKDIFLEAANFTGSFIRSTRTKLGLDTEASYRFERELRPELAPIAIKRAISLFIDLCEGQTSDEIIDVYPVQVISSPLKLTAKRLNKILGTTFTLDTVWPYLESLGFERKEISSSVIDLVETLEAGRAEGSGESIEVVTPYWRSDIHIEDDLIEEFARTYGYDNLPVEKLSSAVPDKIRDPISKIRTSLRDSLSEAGLSEVVSYAVSSLEALNLTSEIGEDLKTIKLANPMDSTRAWLRTGLEANLLETLERNIRHNPNRAFKLFELGHIFNIKDGPQKEILPDETEQVCGIIQGPRNLDNIWNNAYDALDFYDLKGMVDYALNRLNVDVTYSPSNHRIFKKGHAASISSGSDEIGYIGHVDQDILDKFGINNRDVFLFTLDINRISRSEQEDISTFRELSRFPSSSRDIALLCPEQTSSSQIEKIVQAHKLVVDVFPSDQFVGDEIETGWKSITYRIIFQSMDKTLETGELEKALKQIFRSLSNQLDVRERFSEQQN